MLTYLPTPTLPVTTTAVVTAKTRTTTIEEIQTLGNDKTETIAPTLPDEDETMVVVSNFREEDAQSTCERWKGFVRESSQSKTFSWMGKSMINNKNMLFITTGQACGRVTPQLLRFATVMASK